MPHAKGRAFTAVELVVSVGVVGVVLCVLMAAGSRARCASQLSASTANLERVASLSASYNADHQDRTPALSWRGGAQPPSEFADLRAQAVTGTDQVACAAQAVDIIRRRSSQGAFPLVSNWVPHISYWHLVLVDYGAMSLPEFDFVSPADAVQLTFARSGAEGDRSVFASSYEMHPYFWQPERFVGGPSYSGVQQASIHSTFVSQFSVSGILGPRSVAAIRYPSQKAFVYDKAQRHFGPSPIYFAFGQARVLALAADGNAAVRHTGETTQGFSAGSPRNTLPLTYSYQPLGSEPPLPPGSSATVYGHLRWTRGGLEGRDFDGANIDTSAW